MKGKDLKEVISLQAKRLIAKPSTPSTSLDQSDDYIQYRINEYNLKGNKKLLDKIPYRNCLKHGESQIGRVDFTKEEVEIRERALKKQNNKSIIKERNQYKDILFNEVGCLYQDEKPILNRVLDSCGYLILDFLSSEEIKELSLSSKIIKDHSDCYFLFKTSLKSLSGMFLNSLSENPFIKKSKLKDKFNLKAKPLREQNKAIKQQPLNLSLSLTNPQSLHNPKSNNT